MSGLRIKNERQDNILREEAVQEEKTKGDKTMSILYSTLKYNDY